MKKGHTSASFEIHIYRSDPRSLVGPCWWLRYASKPGPRMLTNVSQAYQAAIRLCVKDPAFQAVRLMVRDESKGERTTWLRCASYYAPEATTVVDFDEPLARKPSTKEHAHARRNHVSTGPSER